VWGEDPTDRNTGQEAQPLQGVRRARGRVAFAPTRNQLPAAREYASMSG
jgi:hypothetical protein